MHSSLGSSFKVGANQRHALRAELLAVGLGCALALAGCAAGRHHAAPPATPLGAEVLFSRIDPGAVSTMIADRCRAVGWAVDRADTASVTCTVSVPGRQRLLTALMMRNPKGQTQSVSHHFLIAQAGDEVRVRSESWLSDPDRGRRRELAAAKAAKVEREMAGFLVLMGGRMARPGDAVTRGEP